MQHLSRHLRTTVCSTRDSSVDPAFTAAELSTRIAARRTFSELSCTNHDAHHYAPTMAWLPFRLFLHRIWVKRLGKNVRLVLKQTGHQ